MKMGLEFEEQQGLKPSSLAQGFTARLKSCPDTKRSPNRVFPQAVKSCPDTRQSQEAGTCYGQNAAPRLVLFRCLDRGLTPTANTASPLRGLIKRGIVEWGSFALQKLVCDKGVLRLRRRESGDASAQDDTCRGLISLGVKFEQVWGRASASIGIALSVVRRARSVMSGMRLHTGSL